MNIIVVSEILIGNVSLSEQQSAGEDNDQSHRMHIETYNQSIINKTNNPGKNHLYKLAFNFSVLLVAIRKHSFIVRSGVVCTTNKALVACNLRTYAHQHQFLRLLRITDINLEATIKYRPVLTFRITG